MNPSSPEILPRRVLVVHLRDDLSGSARVCSEVVSVLRALGVSVRVIVGHGGAPGFIRLDHQSRRIPYFAASKSFFINLMSFCFAQLCIFFATIWSVLFWRAEIVYVSTVLPGAANLAGACCGARVITHMHEVGLPGDRPHAHAGLFSLLLRNALITSTDLVVVSSYMKDALDIRNRPVTTIANFVSDEFVNVIIDTELHSRLLEKRLLAFKPFVVTLVCSLKLYKGIDSFLALAALFLCSNERYQFRLILNSEEKSLAEFIRRTTIPENVVIYRRPKRLKDIYLGSHLVLNLSHKSLCIETFGLTLVEAMACGVPVICPTTGGVTDVVLEGRGGWFIDSLDLSALASRIKSLSNAPLEWEVQATYAFERSLLFSRGLFEDKIRRLFSVKQ